MQNFARQITLRCLTTFDFFANKATMGYRPGKLA